MEHINLKNLLPELDINDDIKQFIFYCLEKNIINKPKIKEYIFYNSVDYNDISIKSIEELNNNEFIVEIDYTEQFKVLINWNIFNYVLSNFIKTKIVVSYNGNYNL